MTADAYQGTKGSYLSIVFFVLVALLGMYIVLSLFVSILLERFAGQDAHKFEMENQTEEVGAAPQYSKLCGCCGWDEQTHTH